MQFSENARRIAMLAVCGTAVVAFVLGQRSEASESDLDVSLLPPIVMHAQQDRWHYQVLRGIDADFWLYDKCEVNTLSNTESADSVALLALGVNNKELQQKALKCLSESEISARTARTMLVALNTERPQPAYRMLLAVQWDSIGLGSAIEAATLDRLGVALDETRTSEEFWFNSRSPGALALLVETARHAGTRPAVVAALGEGKNVPPEQSLLVYRRGEVHDAPLIKHIAEQLYDEAIDGRINATSERALRLLAAKPSTTGEERAAIWGTILARSPAEDLTTLGGSAVQLLSESDARLTTMVMIGDLGRNDASRRQAARMAHMAMNEHDGHAMLTTACMMRKTLEEPPPRRAQ